MVSIDLRMKQRIAVVRRRQGITQAELARRVGATASMIGKLERSERDLNFSWVTRIADALNVSTAEIIDTRGTHLVPGDLHHDGSVTERDGFIFEPSPAFVHGSNRDDDEIELENSSSRMGFRAADNINIKVPVGSEIVFTVPAVKPAADDIGKLVASWIYSDDGGYQAYVGVLLPGTQPNRFHLLPLNGTLVADANVDLIALIETIHLP